MLENEMKEILDLVLEISTETDVSVSYDYDSENKILGVLAEGKLFTISNGKFLKDEADVVGLPGIHIEVKRRERLNIYDAIDQAKRDRKPEELPAVFHRKNHCEWLVTMTLEDWMQLYREWEAGYGLCEDQQENP